MSVARYNAGCVRQGSRRSAPEARFGGAGLRLLTRPTSPGEHHAGRNDHAAQDLSARRQLTKEHDGEEDRYRW